MISPKQNPPIEQLKVPPHSIAAEQGIIGALLMKNELLDNANAVITAEDFYARSHQVLFRAINDMNATGRAADMGTLPDYLLHKNQLDEVGGEVQIYEICRNVPSTANFSTYAQTVRNRSLQRQAIAAAMDIQEQCYHSDGSDVIDILGAAEQRLGEVSEKLCTKEQDYSIGAALTAAVDEIEHRMQSGKEISGISTGLLDLDKKLNGLEPADMVVVAARPSMGKTTLAMNMVTTEAVNGGNPIVFSMEMPKQQLIYKMLSSLGQIDISDIQRPNGNKGEGGAVTGGLDDVKFATVSNTMARLKQTNLSIIDDAYMTIPRMRLELRRYQKEHGKPTLIMADYLQLIRGTTKSDNRTNEISEISRGIKALAKEFNCPFIILSQLNRSLETRNNKRPINSDLRESGQIEQDADKILFIYRDDVYNENSQDKGCAELIVSKCRMGEIGMVPATFRGQYSEFKPFSGRKLVGFQPHQKKAPVEEFKG